MKMQRAYGVFDDEADGIIDLVRRHAQLAEIRGAECPVCGAAMTVDFAETGDGFQVFCQGTPLHLSKHQDIANPPPWWRECVVPATDSTWYWRMAHSFDTAGNLAMPVSGYLADGAHWSGRMECPADHPDHAFWRWLLTVSGCTSDLIGEAELAELRARFARTA